MSTPGRVRGPYAKTADRRREILEAGIEVFSNSGFRSGSIREIAEKVGMSQAGLLHHFANKSELLAGVLEMRDEGDRVRVPTQPGLGVETIRGLVELAVYNMHLPGLVELHCVLSAEATAPDHPARQYFINRYAYTHDLTFKALQVMARYDQLIPGIDPASVAHSLIALMDGLQVQWLLDRDSVDMGREIRNYILPMLTVGLDATTPGWELL